jgi:hypothetical protein
MQTNIIAFRCHLCLFLCKNSNITSVCSCTRIQTYLCLLCKSSNYHLSLLLHKNSHVRPTYVCSFARIQISSPVQEFGHHLCLLLCMNSDIPWLPLCWNLDINYVCWYAIMHMSLLSPPLQEFNHLYLLMCKNSGITSVLPYARIQI